MKRSTIIQIFVGILLALAIILGLAQRNTQPELDQQSLGIASQHELQQYYQKAQDLAGTDAQKTMVSFLAVGDIMLSRNVAEEIQKHNDPLLPFRNMEGILKSTNFNFGNLESPFAQNNPIVGGHSLIFGAPENNIAGLTQYNFKVVNLANNHALDQKASGLAYTQRLLNQHNIFHVGAGNTIPEAWQPAIIDAQGVRVCFVGASYASVNDSGKTVNTYVARIEDIDNIKTAVTYSQSVCDYTVATMHAGTEYTRNPNQAQVAFAHAAIDAGADMVIGAHPHWIQTTEQYQGKYIFYSLGNFVFDQEWSQDTKEGLTLKITLSKAETKNPIAPGAATISQLQGPRVPAKLESIELIPVILENYSTPRPATVEESQKILQKINQPSTILK